MAQKKLTFTTPKGIAVYPWLNKADYEYDSNGQFKVSLRVTKDASQELVDVVTKAAQDAFGDKAKNARLPFKKDEDTGDTLIATKSKFRPKFMDSTGALINERDVPQIYGGSTLKLAGTIYCYSAGGNNGVSLQLGGVQIIDLSEGSNGGISFEAEEGGFVASNDNGNIETGEGEQSYNF